MFSSVKLKAELLLVHISQSKIKGSTVIICPLLTIALLMAVSKSLMEPSMACWNLTESSKNNGFCLLYHLVRPVHPKVKHDTSNWLVNVNTGCWYSLCSTEWITSSNVSLTCDSKTQCSNQPSHYYLSVHQSSFTKTDFNAKTTKQELYIFRLYFSRPFLVVK